jgi:hypothetical protein
MQEMSGDLFPTFFDDEIAVVTLLASKNILKLLLYISLIGVRYLEMAMVSRVNIKAICDVL